MPNEIKINNRQLIDLNTGFSQLDAVRESKDTLTPIVLDVKTSYRLMRTAVNVEREKQAFDKLDRRNAVECGYTPNVASILSRIASLTQPTTEEIAEAAAAAKAAFAFQQKQAELLEQEVDLEVFFVTIEQLLEREDEKDPKKKKRNPIPQSVINRLAPIIAEEA